MKVYLKNVKNNRYQISTINTIYLSVGSSELDKDNKEAIRESYEKVILSKMKCFVVDESCTF